MNKLTLALVVCGSMFLAGGCMDSRIGKVDPLATPAYSSSERGELIARNMELEWKMMNDDIDSLLLLRPVSSLTIWNVR
jgi:outer membrane murein-binding lipoprotein Lpp